MLTFIKSLIFSITVISYGFLGSALVALEANMPAPYGQGIFDGLTTSGVSDLSNPERKIRFGDRMLVRLWGAKNFENALLVDAEGSIFIPEVGPVDVAQKSLAAAQAAVSEAVGLVYNENVRVHATLAESRPTSVFVTGNVVNPGRYQGSGSDTLVDYLAKAGGILPEAGSYRNVKIRGSQYEATSDLYKFLQNGQLIEHEFADGDIIFVPDVNARVAVLTGATKNSSFEFPQGQTVIYGSNLLDLTTPAAGATHARIERVWDVESKDIYLRLEDFTKARLYDGDKISFEKDAGSSTIEVFIDGDIPGQKSYAVKSGASLKELLSFVSVDPKVTDLSAVHIERPSVAAQQKRNMQDSLHQLQRRISTTQNISSGEASIKSAEASMLASFIKQVEMAEFTGKIVLDRGGKVSDIRLREGDRIILPSYKDTVLISGEVMISNAFLYAPNKTVSEYVGLAGGLRPSADKDAFIIKQSNGNSQIVGPDYVVKNGDDILALPKIQSKNIAIARDVISIIYQVAMGTRAIVYP